MALVSSMVSRGTVPWQNLPNYTSVQNAMTSAEALELSGLNFDVLQEPIFDGMGYQIDGYRLNYKSDDRKVLGLVSDKYHVVQNIEAFAFTDALIGEHCRYETAGAVNNYKTIWLLAQLEPKNIMGDDYNNYLCFMNSFDGGSAVKVCVTPIRVTCKNTLNLAIRSAKRTFSMRHVSGINDKLVEAQKTLQLSSEYLLSVEKTYESLALKRITERQIDSLIAELFPIDPNDPNPNRPKREQRKRDILREYYNVDDLSNFKGTAFGFINAVSDMASHMEPMRMTDSYFGNLFSKVMEGHPYMDKAFELVQAM